MACLQANQHQRELMKEFGENGAELSEAEHLVRVQTSRQPRSFSPGRRRIRVHCQARSANGRTLFTFSPSPSQVVLLGPTLFPRSRLQQAARDIAGRSASCVPRCRRKVLRFCGRKLTWRLFFCKSGLLMRSNTRGVLCSSFPGKMYASVLRAAAVPWLPMSAGMSQTGAVRGGGTEFAIMTCNLLSSWAQLRKLSSAVIFVDIRKAFYSVLVEEVVGPVMGRSDRAKVMARFGWKECERHRFDATLQKRQHGTALLGMASDVAAMLADWHPRCREQRSGRPGDPTANVMFAFAFARFNRKLVERLRKKGLLPAILLHRGQLDASADECEEIHMEPPAYMDDFSCQSSATRLLICFHGLLWPRRSPSRLPGSTGCS